MTPAPPHIGYPPGLLQDAGCRKCGGPMRPGKAIAQTWSGAPDFSGDAAACTMSPGGPGRLIDCLKCAMCGSSVAATKEPT